MIPLLGFGGFARATQRNFFSVVNIADSVDADKGTDLKVH
jgi:hypothetical protein